MITAKYLIVIGGSFLFWIVPLNIPKMPKTLVAFSLLGSMGGYLYAFSLATSVGDQQWYSTQKRIQEREVLLHDIALEEMYLKASLENQYLGPSQPTKEAEAVEVEQQKLAKPSEQKLLTDALPDHLIAILKAAQKAGGKIKHRDAQRAEGLANKFKAEEMKQFFHELQQRGWGTVTSDGRTYTFNLTRAV